MVGEMNLSFVPGRSSFMVLFVVLIAAGTYSLATGSVSLLTPDQRGYRLFEQAMYPQAAEHFIDPMWKGVALFKHGEFEQSAGVFAGFDTAESAFNHGNALVMQGKYGEAAQRYERALVLRPEWEDATINRDIALARAARLKREGGDMTGGMLGADDIVFSEGKSSPSAGEEQLVAGQEMSDAELRAVWLRQVQTKPADFLQAKFAYQQAMRPVQDREQEEAK
jgi:Ca-activated chloride channel family protein